MNVHMHHLDSPMTETCQMFPQFSYEGNIQRSQVKQYTGGTWTRTQLPLSGPCQPLHSPSLSQGLVHFLHPISIPASAPPGLLG